MRQIVDSPCFHWNRAHFLFLIIELKQINLCSTTNRYHQQLNRHVGKCESLVIQTHLHDLLLLNNGHLSSQWQHHAMCVQIHISHLVNSTEYRSTMDFDYVCVEWEFTQQNIYEWNSPHECDWTTIWMTTSVVHQKLKSLIFSTVCWMPIKARAPMSDN